MSLLDAVSNVASTVAERVSDATEKARTAFENTVNGTANQPAPQQQAGSGSGETGSTENPNGSASGTGLIENSGQAVETIVNPADQIARLNSDGDQVVMSMTAEGKLQVPIPVGNVPIGIGGKGQYGYDITVQQAGDQNPTYDVTFDKNLLGGATIEPPIPGIDPAAELNLRTAGSVTMSFASQEEATRAVETLQRLALSETVRDTGSAISPLPTGSNPAANPVPESGSGLENLSPTDPIADRIEPSGEDMAFLRDHVTTYSSAVGAQERLKVAAKFANMGIEPRFDGNQWLTRTVTLPQDGQPGRVTYTLSGDLEASTKEKLTIGKQQFDQLEIGYVPQNIVDHGRLHGEVSMSWDVPADAMGPTVSGQPVPEIAAFLNGDLRAPDEVSARFGIDYQTQSLTDLSRTDHQRLSIEATTRNPTGQAGAILSNMLNGDLEGAFRGMGEDFTVTATNEAVRRDGIEQQHEIGAEVADIIEGKVSLIAEIGLDDVTSRHTGTMNGNDIADALWGPQEVSSTPPVDETPADTPENDQYVVVPLDGLNVREQPGADAAKVSAYQHGSFVDATGQTQTAADGSEWVEVTGLDPNDQVVTGWVDRSYLQPHAGGDMDETGRINPDLEALGYEQHTVQPGDTIWDLAHRDGVNFNEMLRLNQDHLINPGMIFPGDTVYIPGTEQPVEPPVTPQPEQPAPSDSSGSGSSDSTSGPGSTDSSSGSSESGSTGSQPDGSPSAGQPNDSSGSESAPPPSGDQPNGSSGSESGATGDQPTPPPSSSGSDSSSSGSGGSDSTSGSGGDTPVTPAPVDPAPVEDRPNLDDIRRDYQVQEEETTTFTPNVDTPFGEVGIPGAPSRENIPVSEAEALDSLGLFGLNDLNNLAKYPDGEAYSTADQYYPPEAGNEFYGQNDGHNDAFRHAYLNARMTQMFGAERAEALATTHEALPGNPANREAMDLYNNELGRRIATENPDASPEELAELVHQAVENGDAIVIDGNTNLAWSDQVGFHQHGIAPDVSEGGEALPGQIDAGELPTGS